MATLITHSIDDFTFGVMPGVPLVASELAQAEEIKMDKFLLGSRITHDDFIAHVKSKPGAKAYTFIREGKIKLEHYGIEHFGETIIWPNYDMGCVTFIAKRK